MFSIAAINDTDSKEHWEPLAPTKEAQEFHLSQTYHEGLLKLQAKEYDEARKLLEIVLKDPLLSSAEVDSTVSDGHMLQLRFLALKNLATVFLQLGSSHYERALHCYLQAVEIDTKDSVIWNQLGTLSCSMDLLSISRWAFEQGLLCSPNNWNCMEKLLEVLIAIGDEVACLSVSGMILRHWPSHSRALHVKKTIEDSEPVPYAPRGIDKLEPKHVRLKFLDKRKETEENLDEGVALKKQNQSIELSLTEASWAALADALLEIMLPLSGHGFEKRSDRVYQSGDVRLTIHFPCHRENAFGSAERQLLDSVGESTPTNDGNNNIKNLGKEGEAMMTDEQPHERRSTRLERLRSRKPEKEESDISTDKDPAKAVLRVLESYVVSGSGTNDSDQAGTCSAPCSNQLKTQDTEYNEVASFVNETSKNHGAYHLGHLLLEKAARGGIANEHAFPKFLELEKLTRHWGQNRTPECSLFLAELYYDLGSLPSNASNRNKFMSEASYHFCKIIESVALDHPFDLIHLSYDENFLSKKSVMCSDKADSSMHQDSLLDGSLSTEKCCFWARYFWLCAQLSILDGNKAKANKESSLCLSLLVKKEQLNDSHDPHVVRPQHCRISGELIVDKVIHEINLLNIDFLLEKTVGVMIEKEMYMDCINLLAPLLFSANDSYLGLSSTLATDTKDEALMSVELSALDILIKACEKTKPMDAAVYLNCHIRKLQVLMMLAGMDEWLALCNPFHQMSGLKMLQGSDIVSKENSVKKWSQLVVEEVKETLQCVSRVKTCIDQFGDSKGITIPTSRLRDIQALLLAVMCNVASNFLYKKSSGPEIADPAEQKYICCFIHAAIAFCKVQHFDPMIPIKTQVDLIVALHDLLAENGLCCAGEGDDGAEGTFLKFAIKHLLALDMKLKSSFNSSEMEATECGQQKLENNYVETSPKSSKSDMVDIEVVGTETKMTSVTEKESSEVNTPKYAPVHSSLHKNEAGEGNEMPCHSSGMVNGENPRDQQLCATDLTEDEREELEEMIDNALDQCFFCLYGLNLRSDSSYEDDLAIHKNTSRGDYQTKEQCADVFKYLLPYAKASSKTGLVKLRRVLRTIRKHFPQPPEDVLAGNMLDKFLDDLTLYEEKLSEEAGSDCFLENLVTIMFSNAGSLKQYKKSVAMRSEPYLEVYCNLYYFLAQSEEMSASDKWPGFVLTKEGEDFVQQNASLFKYDLLYNPMRFESWQRLATIYDEEVDLLLNDGSKHINVAGWRKNPSLPQRVETSRRRSRRCLLMSLALAKTPAEQCEIHELLALVYYDSLQNVVPLYDQRSVMPSKDATWITYCENSLRHFKKAFSHKEDWSYAFYMGKLCQKLGYSHEIPLSYYDKAIALNSSAVDPVYRMHASRLKLLTNCGKQNLEVLKVLSTYSFSQSTKDSATNIIDNMGLETSNLPEENKDDMCQAHLERENKESKLEEVWHMLYNDCLTALHVCIEGDLKHFHKARYMLSHGLYKRGETGDLEKAKDELSFCFKSTRSSFTINMWEIDSMVKKGRRKTPTCTGSKRALEVNLAESSRKFITCIRKYLLFYLRLLEENGDMCTLERAYVSIRADKRFSLCLEDLVPVALGRYIKALVSSRFQADIVSSGVTYNPEQQLEKIFSLFMEQGHLWQEICSLSELKSPEVSDSTLYGYLHRYISLLEIKGKLDTLEGINERIRKRFKNTKLSNNTSAKVCKHASVAWCRSLINNLALITPTESELPQDTQVLNQTDTGLESSPLLYVEIQTNELWSSSFEDPTDLESLKTKWSTLLTNIRNTTIKKASDQNMETATSLLRSSYNFYRESSCVTLPTGVNLYLVRSRSAAENFQPGMEGAETLDLSTQRKLLMWAYTLLHGRCTTISVIVKYCEENAKSKLKKGSGNPFSVSNTSMLSTATAQTGGGRDGSSHVGRSESEATSTTPTRVPLPEGENTPLAPSSEGNQEKS